MAATEPRRGAPEWYAAAAAKILPSVFMCLRDPNHGLTGWAALVEWTPGDHTLYQITLSRWRGDLAVALLNCEQRAGVVPFLPEDLHAGYVGGALKLTNEQTMYAVTALINEATRACLGRPVRGA